MKLRFRLLSSIVLCAGCLSWPYARVDSKPHYNGSKSVAIADAPDIRRALGG